MKLYYNIILAAFIGKCQSLRNAAANSRRLATTNDEISVVEFTTENGSCNYDLLETALAEICTECDLISLLGKRLEADARDKVDTLCHDAIANNSNSKKGTAFAFGDITEQGYQFDNEFFDGGTALNAEYEPVAIADSRGGWNIEDVFNDNAQEQLITYPNYIEDNFGDCEAQAVMCCWVQDRQANDDNGNCADDNCLDADPADNTDICYVDLAAASTSNHVEGGFALFPGNTATTGEGDAHCHGFAWSNDANSPDYRYRGNALFFVSMYDHLDTRGYVRNVPGAPMCSCIDKSPTVSRSDCTNVEVEETFVFTTIVKTSGKTVIRDASIENVAINFNNCPTDDGQDNDLKRWYDQEFRSDPASASDEVFDLHLVEDCNDGDHYAAFLDRKGYALK